MAYLLGSKFCIESLQSDVKDLQVSVADVLSRVGPVRYPSWKYPDKISSDIDIQELLENSEFNDGEDEDNQVAHILLFELVIDRMMLLLQSFAHYADQLLTSGPGRPATASSSRAVGNQMSIGLVVKKCWNKMVQLNVILQQLQSENRTKSRSLTKLEHINHELQEQTKHIAESIRSNPTPMSFIEHSQSITPDSTLFNHVAKDTRTISSQTIETCFVPCEACYQVQLGFKDVSDTVVEVCKSQGLSSAVMKHRKTATEETMTAADVHRWRKEEQKDLQKIREHLTHLMEQINPLKTDLKNVQDDCSKLNQDLSNKTKIIAEERKTRESAVAQYEIKIKNIKKEHKDSLSVVQRSYDDLTKGKRKVDGEIIRLKQELVKQYEQLQELDIVKKQLNKMADDNTEKKNSILRLESDVKQMTQQLADTHKQLEDASKKLGKEQAKNRSLEKQSQTMQVKMDNLVARIDELDTEGQDLKDNIAELEDAKEEKIRELEETMISMDELKKELHQEKELVQVVTNEKQTIEQSVHDLQTMILTLEDQLKDSHEREKMLVQYPEKNPNLPTRGFKSDNEEVDKKHQVQANNIRIQVLEEENSLLRDNIGTLLDRSGNKSSPNMQVIGPGVQLWQKSALQEAQLHAANNNNITVSPRSHHANNLFSISSLPKHTLEPIQQLSKNVSNNQRGIKPTQEWNQPQAKSGKRHASVKQATSKSSSINAYMKLKNSGSLTPGVGDHGSKAGAKPPKNVRQGWASDDRSSFRPGTSDSLIQGPSFCCPSCDKMYSTQRDLDIHKSYCYG